MFTEDQCHMLTEMSRDVTTQILCVLIGQGRLSRPMICLRCRSAYLIMLFTTIEATWCQRHLNQGLDFQRQYISLRNIVSIL